MEYLICKQMSWTLQDLRTLPISDYQKLVSVINIENQSAEWKNKDLSSKILKNARR